MSCVLSPLCCISFWQAARHSITAHVFLSECYFLVKAGSLHLQHKESSGVIIAPKMLRRESANVGFKSGDADALLIPFAQCEIFLPGMPRAGRCWNMQGCKKGWHWISRTLLGFQEWVWGALWTTWNWMQNCALNCLLLGRGSNLPQRDLWY